MAPRLRCSSCSISMVQTLIWENVNFIPWEFSCSYARCRARRPAGTSIWARGLFLDLCALMALYGLTSFSYHEFMTSKGQSLDRTSWTNRRIFDAAAIDFARRAYAQEGRDALFVLPLYQLGVTLPIHARVFAIDINWATEAEIEGSRDSGRAQVMSLFLPNTIFDWRNGTLDIKKGPALLSAFTDYDPNAWEKKIFTNMTVFFQ